MADPLMTEHDLYERPATDPMIDSKARCFRECDAMLAHFLARGMAPECDDADEIAKKSVLLDVGIEKRAGIDKAELMILHAMLAKAIKPAIPRTIEILHWDARTNWWNWVAPVSAVRKLIFASIGFFALLIATMLRPDLSEFYELGFLDSRNDNVLLTIIFYISLAGLGACFSVLHDARKYVVEGTYDPRIGSNYFIRILLGVLSGVILAQLLFDSIDVKTATPGEIKNGIGKPIMALLGGFSAQFVYKGLQKLVESLTLVFDSSPEDRIALREKEIRVEVEEEAIEERLERSTKSAELVAEIGVAANDPVKVVRLAEELAHVSAGGKEKASSTADEAVSVAEDVLRRARSVQNLGAVLEDVLPDDESEALADGLASIATQVNTIDRLLQSGKTMGLMTLARDLETFLDGDDPTLETLIPVVRSMIKPAQAAGLLGGPSGLALAILAGTVETGVGAYGRWKAKVLAAPYSPDLLPPDLIDDGAARAALAELPALGELITTAGMDNPAGLSDFAKLVVQSDVDALYNRIGGDTPRPDFDVLVEAYQKSLLQILVVTEVPKAAVALAEAPAPTALLAALESAQEDAMSRAELEKLFLIADRIRFTGDANADAALRAALKAAAREITL